MRVVDYDVRSNVEIFQEMVTDSASGTGDKISDCSWHGLVLHCHLPVVASRVLSGVIEARELLARHNKNHGGLSKTEKLQQPI